MQPFLLKADSQQGKSAVGQSASGSIHLSVGMLQFSLRQRLLERGVDTDPDQQLVRAWPRSGGARYVEPDDSVYGAVAAAISDQWSQWSQPDVPDVDFMRVIMAQYVLDHPQKFPYVHQDYLLWYQHVMAGKRAPRFYASGAWP